MQLSDLFKWILFPFNVQHFYYLQLLCLMPKKTKSPFPSLDHFISKSPDATSTSPPPSSQLKALVALVSVSAASYIISQVVREVCGAETNMLRHFQRIDFRSTWDCSHLNHAVVQERSPSFKSDTLILPRPVTVLFRITPVLWHLRCSLCLSVGFKWQRKMHEKVIRDTKWIVIWND